MASYINRKQAGVTGVGDWIPLNRWSKDSYSIVTTINGASTYTVEFTLDQINRSGVLGSETARPVEGGTALTADANLNIANTPMEAIRINVASGDVDFHVMQNGD